MNESTVHRLKPVANRDRLKPGRTKSHKLRATFRTRRAYLKTSRHQNWKLPMVSRVESDEWLMGQVRRGKRDALEKLLRRYASPLLTFIVRMLGDRHRGEEVFQDVFLAVWTKRRRYKLNHPFRAWLYTIAANRCRSEHRKKKLPVAAAVDPAALAPTVIRSSSGQSDADDSPVGTAISTETAEIVSEAVARLPAQQRTVVVLRIYNGLSFAEIAEIGGTAESTARSNMHRALATLRETLGPMVGE